MHPPALPAALGPALSSALAQKGYTTLTSVQEAVLNPALAGRDLRITSQTGSGKTVAIGLALRSFVADGEGAESVPPAPSGGALARPRALVVAPTRELAKQVEEELSWLYAPLGVRIVSVTGGSSVRDERRALAGKPGILVGTPGRLLDHLKRGAVDGTGLAAVVLDEADRLLDLGFREDLEAILAFAPEGHRTHLVSATFPREVKALADATQDDPVHVEGTRLGAANADIDHVVYLIDSRERVAALINILLSNPDEQTLVFARTRADVAAISHELRECGFAVSSLSGEMDQTARNRALAGFKRGDLRVLVATDVAARGIDVQDIARVVHAEPPSDSDSYTHRSGRTGRAGRKGTSCILAVTAQLARTNYLLQRAGVAFRFEPIPSADSIRASAEERMLQALTAEDATETSGLDERIWALAKRVAAEGNVTRAIARLLLRTRYAGPTEPRVLRIVEPPGARGGRSIHDRNGRPERAARGRPDRGDVRGRPERSDVRGEGYGRPERSDVRSEGYGRPERSDVRGAFDTRAPRREAGEWVPFHVSWGQEQGADARRLLAVICRRGAIRGTDVGSIRVSETHSVVDIASHVAEAFARAAGAPDPREPRIVIKPEREQPEKDRAERERPERKQPERDRAERERPEKKERPGREVHAAPEHRPAARKPAGKAPRPHAPKGAATEVRRRLVGGHAPLKRGSR